MSENEHVVYVYGTLRPGSNDTVRVPGHLYELGWYPGIKLLPSSHNEGPFVLAERLVVDDNRLRQMDYYEGHIDGNPEKSFFHRHQYLDGWIYVFMGDVDNCEKVSCNDGVADWLAHTGKEEGRAASRFSRG